MKLRELLEEIKAPEGSGIIMFDIDDTLVSAVGIKIYKEKNGKLIKALTPEEFAKEDVKKEKTKGFNYNYKDFSDGEKMANSILKGIPKIPNLKMLDAHLRAGWDIGFLTARGGEEANKEAIMKWLKFVDKDGKLKQIPKERIKYFIAVNDKKRINELKKRADVQGDFDAKGVYLKDIQKKYKHVKFIDDDMKNILNARKVLPKKNVVKV